MKLQLGIEAGPDTLELAAELGATGVPIQAADLAAHGVAQTLAPLQEKGLKPCQICAFGFNPLAPDPDAFARELAVLEKAIPLADQSGCPVIVINGGNYNQAAFGNFDARNFQPEAIDAVAAALAPLVEQAAAHDAVISIEPYLKTVIDGPDTFRRLHEKLGAPAVLRANVDPSSLYDFRDAVDASDRVRAVCEGLAGHYGLIHVKEIGCQPGFHLQMGLCPVGEGPTDWEFFFRSLAPHLTEDTWIVVEHLLSPEEARKSVSLVRQAAQAAGLDLG